MDPTLRLAIYGAILSTMLAVWQIVLAVREIGKDRRKLLVTFYAPESADHFGIQAVNNGSRPVVVKSAGLIYRNKKQRREDLHYLDNASIVSKIRLPRKLQDGEILQLEVDLRADNLAYFRKFHDNLVFTKLFVGDTEGHIYKGQLEDYGYIMFNQSVWPKTSG